MIQVALVVVVVALMGRAMASDEQKAQAKARVDAIADRCWPAIVAAWIVLIGIVVWGLNQPAS